MQVAPGNLGDDLNARDRSRDFDPPGHEPADRKRIQRPKGPPADRLEDRSHMSLRRGIKPPSRPPPWIIDTESLSRCNRPAAGSVRDMKIVWPLLDSLRDYVHFAQRNQANSLIELNNSDRSGNPLRM